MYHDIPDELRALVEPVVEDHGYELMNIERIRERPSELLRVTIDSRTGDGRVPVDAIAAVSREVETHLDATDAVADAYRLEVSSPGLDRMLSREKDFAAACGDEVKLTTRRPLDGRRRFRGGLVDFRNGIAVLNVDGDEQEIAFADIEKANVIYAFSSADFHQDTANGRSGKATRGPRDRSDD